MSLRFAYNTNGFAHHEFGDVLSLLSELGYEGIALTLDVHHAHPFRMSSREVASVKERLEDHGLHSVVETGARFLLDPRRKHEPTLVSQEGREQRQDFLFRAIELASRWGSECVSFWSGACPEDVERERAWAWLVEGCCNVSRRAEDNGVRLGFEPEPGMLVETLADYRVLAGEVASEAFGLTFDVGHVWLEGEDFLARKISTEADRIVNIHLEDMRRPVHEHLLFGEGEIDFPPVLAALTAIDYRGLVGVELSRHSHMAPEAAAKAIRFLQACR